jgi:hypothetical protein
MVEIIIVEESRSEAALACIAIALRRPGTRVAEVRTLGEAATLVRKPGAPRYLVIVGWHALQRPLGRCLSTLGEGAAIVGLASNLGEAAQRAVRAGIRRIYEKPVEWDRYLQTMQGILDDWMLPPTRTGA